jgi:hypothetical protein
MSEKKWAKPQMVVLGRGTPDESVLSTCKEDYSGGGYSTSDIKCRYWESGCAACKDQPTS